MYFRKAWDVLLVDDEPDVLAVTKLALKNVKIYEIPLQIHTAGSKAEAIAWLESNPEYSNLALAIIDVIMESDHAGLELCKYIRTELGNRMSPIYIRTGQPGKAPERRVIDELDISGYISKVEATEDRLYTIVKASIREFLWARVAEGLLISTNRLIEAAGVRSRMLEALQKHLAMPVTDRHGKVYDSIQTHACIFVGGELVGTGRYSERVHAEALRTELMASPALSRFGGRLFAAKSKTMLEVGEGPATVQFLAEHSFDTLPDYMVRARFGFLRALQNLWAISK